MGASFWDAFRCSSGTLAVSLVGMFVASLVGMSVVCWLVGRSVVACRWLSG